MNVSMHLIQALNESTTVDPDRARLIAGNVAATATVLDCMFGILSFAFACFALERCCKKSFRPLNAKKYDGPDAPPGSERGAQSLPTGIEIVSQR